MSTLIALMWAKSLKALSVLVCFINLLAFSGELIAFSRAFKQGSGAVEYGFLRSGLKIGAFYQIKHSKVWAVLRNLIKYSIFLYL